MALRTTLYVVAPEQRLHTEAYADDDGDVVIKVGQVDAEDYERRLASYIRYGLGPEDITICVRNLDDARRLKALLETAIDDAETIQRSTIAEEVSVTTR